MKSREEKDSAFARVIENALLAVNMRLENFNAEDALTQNQLFGLKSILEENKNKILDGSIEPYAGQIFGPLKPIVDWGEPDPSELSEAIFAIEKFYKSNY